MNCHQYESNRPYRSTTSRFTHLLTTDRFDRFAAAAAVATTAEVAAHHNVVADGLVTRTESYSYLFVGNGAKGDEYPGAGTRVGKEAGRQTTKKRKKKK